MKKYYPSYYTSFKCLAGECPDTCCAGWLIPVDKKTENTYKILQKKDGVKLFSCLEKDSDGETVIKLKNGRCAFLDKDNLCVVHKIYGECLTSEVCRQHPDFIEEYDGFTEVCPSLSCPAAARLVFDTLFDNTVYPKPITSSEDAYLVNLIELRAYILEKISQCTDCETAVINLMYFADGFEAYCEYIDENAVGFTPGDMPENITSDLFLSRADLYAYMGFLLNETEILTDKWRALLQKTLESFGDPPLKNDGNYSAYAVKMLAYLVYRYFLKAVNDAQLYLRAVFITLSVMCVSEIVKRTGCPFNETARIFSKEIEHNLNNIEKIYDFLEHLT